MKSSETFREGLWIIRGIVVRKRRMQNEYSDRWRPLETWSAAIMTKAPQSDHPSTLPPYFLYMKTASEIYIAPIERKEVKIKTTYQK